MLEVMQLSRSYGNFKAVNNVSFTIKKSEIVGLLGHNGAGKTTIMKMVSGFLEPDQGTINIDNIQLADTQKKVQRHIGYLPENLPVYPEMTVADYLDYAADLKGLSGQNKYNEIKHAIDATDIADKLLTTIATLSRGYKQRVGVAQAVLGKPKLLILDEPTNGLDPEQTQHMRQLIRKLAKHATVILSTHIMQEVEALCSRVLILRNGELAVDSTLESLQQSNELILETSMSPELMHKLSALNGVEHIEPIADSTDNKVITYEIEINEKSDRRKLSALIAEQVFDLNENLYLIHPKHHDLETLFREVNEEGYQQESLNHAA